MMGDPRNATTAITVMPGTYTELSSFYSGDYPVTSMARWQAENAGPLAPVVSFAVMTGKLPQVGEILIPGTGGPQRVTLARDRGAEYADVITGITTAANLPILSVEHSYGSGIGGEAERLGAPKSERISLAGIGMTREDEPNPDVKKIYIQAPNDINRLYDGTGLWDLGFPNLANESNGFTEMDSGMGGISPELNGALFAPTGPLVTTIRDGFYVHGALDAHLDLFKGDSGVNPKGPAIIVREAGELGSLSR